MFGFFKNKMGNKKPDGTIKYTDKDGKTQEKWIPPDKLNDLLEKGGAKRMYKVLVKGPWKGVKEDYWELDTESLKKFGDENDTVRAICVYEKGEPSYFYTSKRMWDKWEKASHIVSNPNLSQEQQTEEINKFLSEQ